MNKVKRKLITCWCMIACPVIATAQANSLSLDTCYALAKQNYPLIKQHELIVKSREYSLQNIAKGYLPQINISGQATYQSDVTKIPIKIPGMDIPELSKDQYKIYAEVNQPVYDGGVIAQQKKIREADAAAEEQSLEVQLYLLKSRVNQLFFGILLIDAQLRQNELTKQDIQSGLNQANAAIANGAALKSSADVLKAELLQAGQHTTELKANRKAYLSMMSLFVNRNIDERTVFIRPPTLVPSSLINRPELLLYEDQNKILDAQNSLLTAKNRPKLSFFAQGGFGKPAFNILSNSFDPYYIGGLRLSIPLSGFYTLKNERGLIQINKKDIAVQKATFLFNTQFSLQQQNAEINKLQEVLKADDEIVPLRVNIKKTALAQLAHGVITAGDYLREVNAEDNARQTRTQHEIQLLLAQYDEQVTTGN